MAPPTGVAPVKAGVTDRRLHDFGFGSIGRGPECRTRAERFWRPLWSLDRPLNGPGDGSCTRDLLVGSETCFCLHHTRISPPLGKRSAAQSFAPARADPAAFPAARSARCSLHPARLSKGSADNTLPAPRPVPGNPDGDRTRSVSPPRPRPRSLRRDKQKTPRSFPRAGFRVPFRDNSSLHRSSPRASGQAFRAWLWRSASIACGPPKLTPGNSQMDRDSRRTSRPGSAYRFEARDNVTEVFLLRFSVALTRDFRQGSWDSASNMNFSSRDTTGTCPGGSGEWRSLLSFP